MPAPRLSPSFGRPLLAVSLLLGLTANASAQVVTSLWNGATGNWTDPSLWSPAVPNNGTPAGTTYNATLNGAGTLTVNTDVAIQQLNISQGTINVQAGMFSVNAGVLSSNPDGFARGTFNVGSGATLQFSSSTQATFDFSSSINGAGTARFLNNNFAVLGEYNVSGTTDIRNGQLSLRGGNAFGALILSNGSLVLNGSSTASGPLTWGGGNFVYVGGTQPIDLFLNGGSAITGTAGNLSISGANLRVTLNRGETVWSGGNLDISGMNTLTNVSTLTITGNNSIRNNSLTVTGGTFNNAGLIQKVAGTGITNLAAGRIHFTNTGRIDALAGTVSLSPTTPTLFLFGTTNQGTVTIGPGATVNGPFTNGVGGVVRGTGTLGQDYAGTPTTFLSGSSLSAGVNGPGILTLTGAVAMSGGARYNSVLSGTVPGTGYGQLALAPGSTIQLGGATLSTSLGYKPSSTDVLALLLGGGTVPQVTGTFANASPGSVIFVGTFDGTDYDARINYTPNSVFLDNFQVVPEPASLALTAFAVGAGVVVRLRRRK